MDYPVESARGIFNGIATLAVLSWHFEKKTSDPYVLLAFWTSQGRIKSSRNQYQIWFEFHGQWEENFQEHGHVVCVRIPVSIQRNIDIEASSWSFTDVIKIGFGQLRPECAIFKSMKEGKWSVISQAQELIIE